jgi:hypothetical protein
MSSSSWLHAVPYGGYPQNFTQGFAQGGHAPAWGKSPYVFNPQAPTYSMIRVGADGASPMTGPITTAVALTLAGLAVFGGGGALVGYLLGQTKVAALWGALFGLTAPPIIMAVRSAAEPAPALPPPPAPPRAP